MPAHSIVAISGTNRPGNYTSHALAVTVDELRKRGHGVDVRERRALRAVFGNEIVELGRENQFGADHQGTSAGGFARAGESLGKAVKFVSFSVHR